MILFMYMFMDKDLKYVIDDSCFFLGDFIINLFFGYREVVVFMMFLDIFLIVKVVEKNFNIEVMVWFNFLI